MNLKTLLILAALTLASLSQAASASFNSSISVGEAVGVGVYRVYYEPPRGVILRVKVEVYPGSGKVNANIRGDDVFMSSLIMACYEAALLAGFNPWSLDFSVEIESEDVQVTFLRGPSLSLPVFLATYSALTGVSIKPSLVSTGAVQPDGLIGWVGDIELKAETISLKGYQSLLIPLLQNVTIQEVLEYYTIGPYISETRRLVIQPLDLGEPDVTVYQSAGLLESIEVATSTLLPWHPVDTGRLRARLPVPESRIALAYETSRIYEAEIERDLNMTLDILSRNYERFPRASRDSIIESVGRARYYLELSRELRLRGYVIAPIDALTLAYSYAKYAKYLALLLDTGDYRQAVREAFSAYAVSSTIINLVPVATPDHLLTLAYAASLLDEASDYLSRAILLARIEALGSDYAMMILANAVASSLKAQMLTLMYLADARGLEIPFDRIYNASIKAYEYYYTAATYSLLYTIGSTSEMRNQAEAYLSTARRLASAQAYPRALQKSIESTARGLTLIALPAPLDPLKDARIASLERYLSLELSRVRRVPLMTLYYLELASLQNKPEYKLYYLELALAYLRAYRMLHLISGVSEDYYSSFWAKATSLEGPIESISSGNALQASGRGIVIALFLAVVGMLRGRLGRNVA